MLVCPSLILSFVDPVYGRLPARCKRCGGAEEARTPDPLLAKEVLSQLSYGPLFRAVGSGKWEVRLIEPLLPSDPESRCGRS